jgi:hypothetical protein
MDRAERRGRVWPAAHARFGERAHARKEALLLLTHLFRNDLIERIERLGEDARARLPHGKRRDDAPCVRQKPLCAWMTDIEDAIEHGRNTGWRPVLRRRAIDSSELGLEELDFDTGRCARFTERPATFAAVVEPRALKRAARILARVRDVPEA